jgi:ribonucleoside-diphosphate reductase alpha chain
MHLTQKTLSDIIVYNKYAKYIESEQRRENWSEIVDRYSEMMTKKYPALSLEIEENIQYIHDKKVLMSMRAAQFAGPAIEKNNSRVYNCAYMPIDNYKSFSEGMFLLLGGTGLGYSVQTFHVEKLPEIRRPKKSQKFIIEDSIEGWADAVKHLMKAYFGKRETRPRFDFSSIRAKGERLITAGGKAPGPEPLKKCLFNVELLLEGISDGEQMTSIQAHDIMCYIADAVLAGGIRRAALIALFSADDKDMMSAKTGAWDELNPQRARANNSAVLMRHRITESFFLDLWRKIEKSNAGEPGILFSNDKELGTNPCAEITLKPYSFCNLTEINGGNLNTQNDFNSRAKIAAFFGTLQAGITDFHYLRPIWQRTTEKDSLIGVGITGIGNGNILNLNEAEAAKVVLAENERVATLIGIPVAARVTTIKPSGTTSLVLGVSSGIHAWHSKYYIRNIQCSVGDDLYQYFSKNHPELIKIMDTDSKSAVIGIPQKAPANAILREKENAIQMLERVKRFYDNWVKVGHRKGNNTNNVSATVYIRPEVFYKPNPDYVGYIPRKEMLSEWQMVGKWMWKNRDSFNGLACLPYDGGSYSDAPFQACTRDEYLNKLKYIENINLNGITEMKDNTTQAQELACSGGACEL